ncbi:hypothetical protein HF673_03130 [Acidithiobacillus thiooxidans]|uniref:HTH cro/C1-type domain-containing protein n=2 Tax=Acidithiobacillus thiooxidans TaxID=930 RepID=A0A1C2J3Y7_ACITH|nr:hypothetical protein [Acidithiobacillus thiooxidans]MBU2834799.1 hypothetical protein [Acidithiobacillus thiooxidans]OCX70602.1 hypothetical protein A6M23_13785 [Acidithiobacillus thiooxidans]OCX82956.1 hypothetical protein A6P08_11305 [Acidithiobacillus thiooxidans]QFX96684.1 hypothetical protein GCD22_02494 [Acidithiobacillus thiooxidans ATCC 19377]
MNVKSCREVRKEIAMRLRHCLQGRSAAWLSAGSGLLETVVEAYLAGRREISIAELKCMCMAMDIPVMRFLVHPDPLQEKDLDEQILAEIAFLQGF